MPIPIHAQFVPIRRPSNVQPVKCHTTVPKNIKQRYNTPLSDFCGIIIDIRHGENTKHCVKSIKWIARLRKVPLPSYSVVNFEDTYCGLCGQTGPLKKTECCGRSICATTETDPKHKTILDVCSRNHSKYTLCGKHHELGHDKQCDWRECSQCKAHLVFLEGFVGYGTNRYNFSTDHWKNAPRFEIKHCDQCGELLKFNLGSVIMKADGTWICQKHQELPPAMARSLLASGNFKVESFGMS